jgi:hypothetical protein
MRFHVSYHGEEPQSPVYDVEDAWIQTNTLLFHKDAWNNRILWFVGKSFKKS